MLTQVSPFRTIAIRDFLEVKLNFIIYNVSTITSRNTILLTYIFYLTGILFITYQAHIISFYTKYWFKSCLALQSCVSCFKFLQIVRSGIYSHLIFLNGAEAGDIFCVHEQAVQWETESNIIKFSMLAVQFFCFSWRNWNDTLCFYYPEEWHTLLLLSWGTLTLRTAVKVEGNSEVGRSEEWWKWKWKVTFKTQKRY